MSATRARLLPLALAFAIALAGCEHPRAAAPPRCRSPS